MSAHLEWFSANSVDVTAACPCSASHPALAADDPSTADGTFAVMFWGASSNAAIFEGSPAELQALLERALAELRNARAVHALIGLQGGVEQS